MTKIIRLTEFELKSKIKNLITERLGVPEQISDTAEAIFYQIYNNFAHNDMSYKEGESPMPTTFRGRFPVGDYVFDELIVSVIPDKRFRSKGSPQFTAFQHAANAKIENYKVVKSGDPSTLKINIVLATGPEWNLSEVARAMSEDRSKVIGTMAHELHHAFVTEKQPSQSMSSYSEYHATQSLNFHTIPPMAEFLHFSYYCTAVENFVRPSEVATIMKQENITKSEFKNFFKGTDVIEMLKRIRNFKLSELIKNLYQYIPEIDDFFDVIEKDKKLPFTLENRGTTDEEKIHAFLDTMYKLICFAKIQEYDELLRRTVIFINPIEALLGRLTGEDPIEGMARMRETMEKREELLKKYTKRAIKYKNYRSFFENEEKRLNFVADKMIRKLSKLYDMAKDDKSSIVNWDLHHKINRTAKKTMNELKKRFRDGSLTISSPTESDLNYIKQNKPKK